MLFRVLASPAKISGGYLLSSSSILFSLFWSEYVGCCFIGNSLQELGVQSLLYPYKINWQNYTLG